MESKLLALLTLTVFGCAFASAQSFGFVSGGGRLYCNYEQLSYAGGGLWGGSDNLSACGFSVNATISGFTATVTNKGEVAHGAGVIYGDSIPAVSTPGNAQWTMFTKLKCNKQNKSGQYIGALGWEGLAAFSGFFAGTNEGFLSCTIPGRNGATPTKGLTTGTFPSRAGNR